MNILAQLLLAMLLQLPRSVTLDWVDTSNPTGTKYNIFRKNELCTGTAPFVRIAQDVSGRTYVDTAVTPGDYCYYVTAVFNTKESVPSVKAYADVFVAPPTSVTARSNE